jgi:1,4-dihydroxy-6-naphthoate synthase
MSAPAPNGQKIRLAHSPDSDDAFMFYALARGKVGTEGLEFVHELHDIETLNRRAFKGIYEVTALSFHAYAFLADSYRLLPHGGSVGDGYGPILVAKQALSPQELRAGVTAIPGELTTAALALRLCVGAVPVAVVPFDQILDGVRAGTYAAGLLIHEGQLTYGDLGLKKVVDLGQWWREETGLPLPLGSNAVRRDLDAELAQKISRVLRASIDYGLAHRDETLGYAQKFGRGLGRRRADLFIQMYVNHFTCDYGERGRQAIQLLLDRAHQAGAIPNRVVAEFVPG